MALMVHLQNVRDKLREKDWKIANLKRQADISYPTAQRAVKDDWPSDHIKLGTLRAVARALDVPPASLLHESDFFSENNK